MKEKISKKEFKIVFSLGSVFTLRTFSTFMTLPVIVSYGGNLKDSTGFLLGLAIGIYGLTQAVFQIPIGMISDRFGRKKLIMVGLFIFITGSVVSAFSKSIWGLIIGRALQGSGAISSAMIANISDSIRERNRIKMKVTIGINFFFIFILAIIFSPIITYFVGLRGLFFISSIFAIMSMLIVVFFIPDQKLLTELRSQNRFFKISMKNIIKNHRLMKLNFGICFLHILLISDFTVLPLTISSKGFLPIEKNWKLYLIILFLSFMIALIISTVLEKTKKIKQALLVCTILFIFSEIIFMSSFSRFFIFSFGLQIFLIAFNIMETLIQTLAKKEYFLQQKYIAMGMYYSFQCFGIMIGGILGGWLLEYQGIHSVFILCIIVSLIWIFIGLSFYYPEDTEILDLKVKELNNKRYDLNLMKDRITSEDVIQELLLDKKNENLRQNR
ncbi:MFS transporter [Candidatus Riesia pediculischaeffi]|uniref:Putative transport protein n=1 Tax=Candidatus Riesia pediculischaeffi PTSU TaxID=1401651 RepID=A0A0C1S020_9ENTR|nr:MFS transporter [Candidatus Riesia pediculischaeffi]KIE63907.1 putative transport protein [Candidatus Riesia pediculischaeffi PTSU]